ncbi:MAG: hypothetical protein IPG60_01940 [Bacteroidetes bacterium]|nr:hypothetical protein [Bacteroidota bacterium]MBP7398609.1 hypothetical protein [Chitinophagales bacterium]MBK7108260.1 hypothetical protein [Bacteroidota bacterium]MBK8486316.1 hypothetical protein [Bacteroidota bacterium]MBK8683098.1 hypothetical protein [Bacteroidota bacterium]
MRKSKKNFRIISLVILISSLIFLPLYSCSQSKAEQLEGKNFTIVTMEKNKPVTAGIEHAQFMDGKFMNKECGRWGFTEGSYTAKTKDDLTTFESTLLSPNEGKMTFIGTVQGGKIEGTFIWSKEGQADINYEFISGEQLPQESAQLNGNSILIKYDDGTGEKEEIITFNNGMLESPACYEWGFKPSPYSAWIDGDKIKFESTTLSEKEGKMHFVGSIRGGEVNGTEHWTKEGQKDISYAFTGWVK